jgi:hypothetical protein
MIIPSSLLAKCRDRIRLIAIEIWRALSKTKAPFALIKLPMDAGWIFCARAAELFPPMRRR